MGDGPALGGGAGRRRDSRCGEALRRRCGSEPRHRRAAAAGRLRRMGVASAEGSAPLASGGRGGRGRAGPPCGFNALRRVPQDCGYRRGGRSPRRRVGHGPDRGSRTRGPGPGCGGHAAVPVRPLVQHLRRQPDVHHGGRVRLLAGPGRRGSLHRRRGPGHGLGPPQCLGGCSAGSHRAVAPVLGLSRAGRDRRPAVDRPVAAGRVAPAAEMDPGDRRVGRSAQRMVGPALLVESGPAQRHGLGQGTPVPVVAVVAQFLRLRVPGQPPLAPAVRRRGGRRVGVAVVPKVRAAPVQRLVPASRGAGGDGRHLRGGVRGDARGTPLERPDPALLLPHGVPDGRPRRG